MKTGKSGSKQNVYIVDGVRTPFLRARGKPGNFTAAELALLSAQPLLLRQSFAASDLDEVILGCVIPAANEANIARVVSLRLGCGDRVPAWTVQRNCGSGMQAVDAAFRNIAAGHSDLVLAGGVEAMSQAPMLLSKSMVTWLSEFGRSRTLGQRLRVLAGFRASHLKPVISLLLGLTDPVVGLSMGRTAEILACQFDLDRATIDEYAVSSHLRLLAAQEQGRLDEVVPIFDQNGNCYSRDDGVRPDSSVELLGKLKPVFDKPYGKITAGNSAQVTDGAAWLILAGEQALTKYRFTPLARVVDCAWAGLDPRVMGLGPVYATSELLQRNHLKLDDISEWEINEAFAAQVLACQKAMSDRGFCRDRLHRGRPLGEIDSTHLNVDGGGISLGHPVGASGARIVLHLQKTLSARQAQYGIAALCIGGGQGGALLLDSGHE